MEHIFIINPASGKKENTKEITEYLANNYSHLNYSIYITKCVGDAIRYVKERCENKSEPLRFYACGGDGTLNEVANGAYGYSDVAITSYPCGSGNDFVKMFGKDNHFKSIDKLINGVEKDIDALEVNNRLSINICNLGFDASVAYNMNKFKRWPLVNGKAAYNLGLVYSLLFKTKYSAKIIIDGEEVFDGKILLSAIGNGFCCGGGYYCLPKADVFDGIMDAVIVKKMSRLTFIKMVNNYKTGAYVDMPKYSKITSYHKCKSLKLISNKDIYYSLDGECGVSKEFDVKIIPNALKMIIPVECL